MKHFTSDTWTEERVERLRTLWADGLSLTVIARELGDGVTRSAVAGKLSRLEGIKQRPTVVRVSPPPRPKVVREPPPVVEKPQPAIAAAEMWHALPGTVPISLEDLTRDLCAWPINDTKPYLFCGCKVARGSFCAAHASVGYRPDAEK